jgi:uncharacterized protein YqgV (UPF0045/DUF77 family)
VAIRAEFTIFPFREGNEMPAHVQAGIDAAQSEGVHVQIGPLSNTICGKPEEVLPALLAAELASVGAGATRVVISVEVESGTTEDREFAQALAATLGPLYRISIVDPAGDIKASFGTLRSERVTRTELPLSRSRGLLRVEFDLGAVEGADSVLRALAPATLGTDQTAGSFTHVDRALAELITLAEVQVGKPLGEMSRAEKQQVVRFLDERGAFALRKSVETVADALGVSRFTVYNYLDCARQANGPA